MSRDWTFFLEDIHAAASKVAEFTQGLTEAEFVARALVHDAVLHNLAVIGEAAGKLPPEARARMPEVDWAKATALRNFITHAYFGLDDRIVWNVVVRRVPEIRDVTGALLARLRQGG